MFYEAAGKQRGRTDTQIGHRGDVMSVSGEYLETPHDRGGFLSIVLGLCGARGWTLEWP